MKKPNYPKRAESRAKLIAMTIFMLAVATVCFHNWMHSTGTAQFAWAGGYIGCIIGTVKEYVYRSRYKKAAKAGLA